MTDFAYTFPPTKWARDCSVNQLLQIVAVAQEVDEAFSAACDCVSGRSPVAAVAVEVVDVIQACETMLRILERDHGLDAGDAVRAVYEKNDARGYYDVQGAKDAER
ncbi:hypothetical protein [Gordonibacter massiliensis (ex Traore et al. 2017)]|uniref:hypothetical protein n=1 Tax=Gordonibacter massiliensis (ex Traore et al. 2017) TaxID=1841863 RepID=UPI001C8C6A17|nr:hypothetical protein [Gordonibacter massiliensis (ex Traore et al. 2017)]MBX9035051.1 hypothetical protein [Gordonibacter massiliensis (ex Traore et al. 2017)]